MSGWIKEKTVKVRHGIVRLVAPQLYSDFKKMTNFKYKVANLPRPMTLFLKNYAKNSLVGAEIGVHEGCNALNILEMLPIQKLFLIDPYTSFVSDGKKYDTSPAKKVAMNKLSKFSNIVFLEEFSNVAIKNIGEPLDFVYIDGDHSYNWVKRDIENYYPLVKNGGVIGGHDYTGVYDGLTQAVDEFAKAVSSNNFYVRYPDWWIVKK